MPTEKELVEGTQLRRHLIYGVDGAELYPVQVKEGKIVISEVEVIPAITGEVSVSSIPAITGSVEVSSLPEISGSVTVTSGDITETNSESIKTAVENLDTKMPIKGQALAADSTPVVLTADQITALTPPAAITGFATSSGQLADGHNVTVDNADGADAVKIQDGGNSITVDGEVSITASALPTNAVQEAYGNLEKILRYNNTVQYDVLNSILTELKIMNHFLVVGFVGNIKELQRFDLDLVRKEIESERTGGLLC